PWVVNDAGDILRRTPGGQWQRLPGRATAVTVATDGTAWILGTNRLPGGYSIHRWSGDRWRRVNGGGVAISAGPMSWLVNSDNQIFRWRGKR
ncbi:MAG TPA: tectonin domain-containing protein, partial [Burkholderiaceae bacterium]|nr:tectonin domain-containing protein [Burkholderiaceae bacterium]